jgi:hypothetical protein
MIDNAISNSVVDDVEKTIIIAFSTESNMLELPSSVTAAKMSSLSTSAEAIGDENDLIFRVERANSLSSASILSMSAMSSYPSTIVTGTSAASEGSISSFDSNQLNSLPCSILKCITTNTAISNNVKKCRKRTLRFDLSKNTTRILDYDDVDYTWNSDDFWYTNIEQDEMKEQSKIDAREWRRQGYHVLLNDTFECPRYDVQDYLNAFVQLPDRLNRRGLERQCSRKQGEERSELKENARNVVFRTQQEFDKLHQLPKVDLLIDAGAVANRTYNRMDVYEQSLSLCYSDASRCAKVYARRLGKADEIEVHRFLGNIGDPTKLSSYTQRTHSSNFLAETATSELVERILEQNGILTPDNQRRIQRRLSNYSATSVNSFDSHRHYQTAIMKMNKNGNFTNDSQQQHQQPSRYQQYQQQQQQQHEFNSSASGSRTITFDIDYEYNEYGVASPKFMTTPTQTRNASIESTVFLQNAVPQPRMPYLSPVQHQQLQKRIPANRTASFSTAATNSIGSCRSNNTCPRSVGPGPKRFVNGGNPVIGSAINRNHSRRPSNSSSTGRRSSLPGSGPTMAMNEALYASIA